MSAMNEDLAALNRSGEILDIIEVCIVLCCYFFSIIRIRIIIFFFSRRQLIALSC